MYGALVPATEPEEFTVIPVVLDPVTPPPGVTYICHESPTALAAPVEKAIVAC